MDEAGPGQARVCQGRLGQGRAEQSKEGKVSSSTPSRNQIDGVVMGQDAARSIGRSGGQSMDSRGLARLHSIRGSTDGHDDGRSGVVGRREEKKRRENGVKLEVEVEAAGGGGWAVGSPPSRVDRGDDAWEKMKTKTKTKTMRIESYNAVLFLSVYFLI